MVEIQMPRISRALLIFFPIAIANISACGEGSASKAIAHREGGTTATSVIAYPLAGAADPLNLRSCPISGTYHEITCRMIGTIGHVKQITWPNMETGADEVSIKFDRSGSVSTICRRAHGEFLGGMSCGHAPFVASPPSPQTKMDGAGRLIQRQHDPFDTSRLDTCEYDDASVPKRSICRDGEYAFIFTYDLTGRALSYTRRRIPHPEESDDQVKRLDKAYALDLVYSYKNDEYGNWTRIEISDLDDHAGTALEPIHFVQTRTIEYY